MIERRDDDLLFEDLHVEAERFSPTEDRRNAQALLRSLFKEQRNIHNDPSRYISVLCPRRAGKTRAAATCLLMACLNKPDSNCVFATITQKMARGLIWNELRRLSKEYELNIRFVKTTVTAILPNGSTIHVTGADSRSEIDKFRGQNYDLFILDECKSFPPRVITELVHEVIAPAMDDCLGTIIVMGTPGNALHGVFYDATRPDSPIASPYGSDEKSIWSFHKWHTKNNIKMPHLWVEQLKRKELLDLADDNPIWRREYLGQWVADHDAFVYKYLPDRNGWEPDEKSDNEWGLPKGHEWQFVLGIDFGWEDPVAMTVSAFSDSHDTLFQVTDHKERHMHVADIARKVFELEEQFGGFVAMVGDSGGGGRRVIEELGHIYGIPLEAAEKTQKRDYIDLLNSDLIEGRIKIRPNGGLADEWSVLVWKEVRNDTYKSREKEDKAFPNHLSDSFLYSWRYCYHHYFKAREITPEYGTKRYWEMKTREDMMAAIDRKRRGAESNYFDDLERDVCEQFSVEDFSDVDYDEGT